MGELVCRTSIILFFFLPFLGSYSCVTSGVLLRRPNDTHEIILHCSQEKVTDPVKASQYAARANVPPYAPPMIPIDNDDGISFKGDSCPLIEIMKIMFLLL